MRRLAGWLASGIDQVGGLPPRSSYMWGGRASPLAYVVFHVIALLRVLSPLQWLKQVFRSYAAARRTTNLRLDFPAAFTEIYFLVLLGAAVAAVAVDVAVPGRVATAGRTIAWLLVLEGAVWVVYYLLLRGLIEGRYTAYHPAEYLLQFPLVVLTQCALLAVLLDQPVLEVLAALRGAETSVPGPGADVLAAAGLVYLGAGVSSLINSLPVITARGAEGFVLVGAGEVARRRMTPALMRMGVRAREVQLFDTVATGPDVVVLPARAIVERIAKLRTPAIIATPTPSHLYYVEALSAQGLPFAVEKPLVAAEAELRRLRDEPELMARGFALGYYALEKALPVTYLMTRREVYCPYLQQPDGSPPPGLAELDDVIHELGVPREVHGWVLEGRERSPSGSTRAWTEQPASLGALVETAVHPLHVAASVLPGLSGFRPEGLRVARYEPRARDVRERTGGDIAPTFVDVRGRVGDVSLRVTVGKHIGSGMTARGFTAVFDKGRLVADFDARCATLRLDDGRRVELHVRDDLVPYQVQLSLFRSMTHRGWAGGRFDQLDQQLEALEAWQAIRAFGRDVAVEDYDDVVPPPGLGPQPLGERCASMSDSGQ